MEELKYYLPYPMSDYINKARKITIDNTDFIKIHESYKDKPEPQEIDPKIMEYIFVIKDKIFLQFKPIVSLHTPLPFELIFNIVAVLIEGNVEDENDNIIFTFFFSNDKNLLMTFPVKVRKNCYPPVTDFVLPLEIQAMRFLGIDTQDIDFKIRKMNPSWIDYRLDWQRWFECLINCFICNVSTLLFNLKKRSK